MGFLEKIYPYCPVWLQNLGISLYGLAYRNERLGGDFDKYVEGFLMRERWSRAEMKSYLEPALREMLTRAFNEVPYYQKVWKEAGIETEDLKEMTLSKLSKIPITPKNEVRLNPKSFVSNLESKNKKLHWYSTSGSTGTPVSCCFTEDVHRKLIAGREARSFWWAQTSIRMSRSMLGGRRVVPQAHAKPPYYRFNSAEKQVYFSAYHISPQNAIHYVEGLNRYQPQLLTGYAYSYYSLARMMLSQGLSLNYQPKALVLSSEQLGNDMKVIIKKAFNARAYEEYGAVENCVLATECEAGSLHVNPDFGIVEIVDENGKPVAPGQEGRVLCTTLLNSAQPLIRYEIDDYARWSDKGCSCGRDALPVLESIRGRLEDAVIGPDGREMVRFHGIFVDLQHVLEGQVIQEEIDQFRVKVVAANSFGAADEELIQKRFFERLGKVKVLIEPVNQIPRTERGKFKAVISKLEKKPS